jgi:hypothetical protein
MAERTNQLLEELCHQRSRHLHLREVILVYQAVEIVTDGLHAFEAQVDPALVYAVVPHFDDVRMLQALQTFYLVLDALMVYGGCRAGHADSHPIASELTIEDLLVRANTKGA